VSSQNQDKHSSNNNQDEYSDPLTYDQEYGSYEPSGSFYHSLALEAGTPILELACGTGRIAIPLAKDGFDVTGVDISKQMLDRASQKSENLAITWIQADCRSFNAEKKFRLIYMTGNSFQAFLTREDQELMLTQVKNHLHLDGFFAFDTRNPDLAELASNQNKEEYWHSYVDSQGRTVNVSGLLTYNPISQIAHYITHRRWKGAGKEITNTSHIDLRYIFPQEMEALLYHNGFNIIRCYGNWDLSPLTPKSPSMIYVCKLR